MATKKEDPILEYFQEKKKLTDIVLKIFIQLSKLKDESEKKKVIDDIRSLYNDVFSEYNPARYIRKDQDNDCDDDESYDDEDGDWEDDYEEDWEDYEDSGIMYISGDLYAGEKHKILIPLIDFFNLDLPYEKENKDIANFYPILRDLVFQVNKIVPPEKTWRESRVAQLLQVINGRFINQTVDICNKSGVSERLVKAMQLGGDDFMLPQKYKGKEHEFDFSVCISDIENLRIEVSIDYDKFGMYQFSETFQSALLDELDEYINRQN